MYLRYGVKDDGELVDINQVGRGRLEGVYCPYCKVGLVARKGKKVLHHFAHDGSSCEATNRDNDTIAIPLIDRFDLNLDRHEMAVLEAIHYTGTADVPLMSYRRRLDALQRLENERLVQEHDFRRRLECTPRGRIPLGDLPLAAFVDEQRVFIRQKYLMLENQAKQLDADLETDIEFEFDLISNMAQVDLDLYEAQLQRLLGATLYLAEVKLADRTLYKIGITTQDVNAYLVELYDDLKASGIEVVSVKPLRILERQGMIGYYVWYRWRDYHTELGNRWGYLEMEQRRNFLADFTRAGNRELTDFELDLVGADSESNKSDVATSPFDEIAVTDFESDPIFAELDKIVVAPPIDNKIVVTPKPVKMTVNDDRRQPYTRQVGLKQYTITCKQCGETVTIWRYPGRAPTLCSDACQRDYKRERDRDKTRARVQRFRAKKRQEKRE